MGALTIVGTIWPEMGALAFVGTLWTEMGALSTQWTKVIQNLPKRVIYFHADVYVRKRTKSTEESDLFPRVCICKRAYEIYRRE